MMGELRVELGSSASNEAVFRCVVPTATGRKEITLNLRRANPA